MLLYLIMVKKAIVKSTWTQNFLKKFYIKLLGGRNQEKTTAYYFIRWTFAGVFCTPIMNPRGAFVGKDSTQIAANISDMLSSKTLCETAKHTIFI